MKKCIKCGSHAFNLYAEGIDQGGLCDVHYWQGRAHRAEALAQPDYRAVKTYHEGKPVYVSQPEQEPVPRGDSLRDLAERYIKEDEAAESYINRLMSLGRKMADAILAAKSKPPTT
jgi:hypothetical protein